MTNVSDFEKRLSFLEPALQLGEINNAISCAETLSEKLEIVLTGVPFLAASGQRLEAIAILADWGEQHPANIEVQFFLSLYLLETKSFDKAAEHFTRAIQLMKDAGSVWFLNSALLMRAYCFAQLGRTEQSKSDLSSVDDGEAMLWIRADPVVSARAIEELLSQIPDGA